MKNSFRIIQEILSQELPDNLEDNRIEQIAAKIIHELREKVYDHGTL